MLKRSLLAASLGLAVLALVPTAQAQSRNSIEIRQSGYANELAARVDGHRNRLSLEQRGVRQFISTLQDGTRNGAQVSQTGSDNQAGLLLNANQVGRGLTVIVLVTLENQKRETMEAFETAVAQIEHVSDCYLTTGAEDYFLQLQVRDARDYERVHRERLSGLPGVARLVSNIAMRTIFTRRAMSVQ